MTFPEPPESLPSDAALAEIRTRLGYDDIPAGPIAGSPNLEDNEGYRRMRERDERATAIATPEPLTRQHLETFVFDPHRAAEQEVAAMARELIATRAEIAVLAAQIDRVRDVHEPIDAMNMRYPGGRLTQVCSGCGTDNGNWQMYPCPTIRALEVRND